MEKYNYITWLSFVEQLYREDCIISELELYVGSVPEQDINKLVDFSQNNREAKLYTKNLLNNTNQLVEILVEAIKANQSIATIRLSSQDSKIELPIMELLKTILNSNNNLSTVYLTYCQIDKLALEKFAQILTINQNIHTLFLSGSHLGNEATSILAKGLQQNQHLINIYLEGNQISYKGMQALAGVLVKNQSIKVIALDDNNIEDESARQLAQLVQTNACLSTVSITKNPITRKGMQYLVQSLESNHNIWQFEFDDHLYGEFKPIIEKILLRNKNFLQPLTIMDKVEQLGKEHDSNQELTAQLATAFTEEQKTAATNLSQKIAELSKNNVGASLETVNDQVFATIEEELETVAYKICTTQVEQRQQLMNEQDGVVDAEPLIPDVTQIELKKEQKQIVNELAEITTHYTNNKEEYQGLILIMKQLEIDYQSSFEKQKQRFDDIEAILQQTAKQSAVAELTKEQQALKQRITRLKKRFTAIDSLQQELLVKHQVHQATVLEQRELLQHPATKMFYQHLESRLSAKLVSVLLLSAETMKAVDSRTHIAAKFSGSFLGDLSPMLGNTISTAVGESLGAAKEKIQLKKYRKVADALVNSSVTQQAAELFARRLTQNYASLIKNTELNTQEEKLRNYIDELVRTIYGFLKNGNLPESYAGDYENISRIWFDHIQSELTNYRWNRSSKTLSKFCQWLAANLTTVPALNTNPIMMNSLSGRKYIDQNTTRLESLTKEVELLRTQLRTEQAQRQHADKQIKLLSEKITNQQVQIEKLTNYIHKLDSSPANKYLFMAEIGKNKAKTVAVSDEVQQGYQDDLKATQQYNASVN